MPQKTYRTVIEYLGLTVGSALMAFGLNFFLQPKGIAPGGVTGLAVIVYQWIRIPIDVTNLAVNIPLFILGIVLLGKGFGLKTAYSTVLLSAFIRLFLIIFGYGAMVTDDILLATIYGGVIMGVGLGMVIMNGGSTGGTDLAGAILNRFIPSISTAKLMMFLDLLIVAAAALVARNIEAGLYSIIGLYILVKTADFLIEGLGYAKAFYIISNKPEEIGKKILLEINRGVTILEGKGMYTGTKRDVLLCVVNRTQMAKLKKLVYEVDDKAFIMISTIHEVFGQGFKGIDKIR